MIAALVKGGEWEIMNSMECNEKAPKAQIAAHTSHELLFMIFTRLDAHSLCQLAQVSTSCHTLPSATRQA